MSAPLVVNTTDGVVWTRRDGSRGGEALYAPEKCGQCPEFVMVTLTELAELGVAGSADALPMPVGPEPEAERSQSLHDHIVARDAEIERLKALVEAMHAAAVGEEKPRLLGWVEDVALTRSAFLAQQSRADQLDGIARRLQERVCELESLVQAATEFRVWVPGGQGLYVRRAVAATGFSVFEARRGLDGRRAWTREGWQLLAVLSEAELFCWPDAVTAVAEARKVLGPEAVAPSQVPREVPDGEHYPAVHHSYRLGHDLPETGGDR